MIPLHHDSCYVDCGSTVNNIVYFNPCSLAELSVGSILGIDCKESMAHLSQLSTREVIECTLLIKRSKVNDTKYENIWESNSKNKFSSNYQFSPSDYEILSNSAELKSIIKCKNNIISITSMYENYFSKNSPSEINDGYWNMHPMFRVIYNKESKDIIDGYHEKRDQILSLPEQSNAIVKNLTFPKTRTHENDFYHRDPLFFLTTDSIYSSMYSKPYISINLIIFYSSHTMNLLVESMGILEDYRCCIRKQLYHLFMAAFLQLNNLNLLLKESISRIKNKSFIEKEESIVESLRIISCLKKSGKYLLVLRDKIVPVMECCNFVSLEDAVKILQNKISYSSAMLCKEKNLGSIEKDVLRCCIIESNNEIRKILSFLKRKYRHLVIKKELRIRYLQRKISMDTKKNTDEIQLSPFFVSSVKELVKKLENEIKEMRSHKKGLTNKR
ncbi:MULTISPECIES: hypothetical protein [Candidatus Ichthyocystis]|uniref:Putative coiled coil protein n=1 Tax=Candidatus Ichthyocystis hellenicum TaxID=1561003 RepID=A0A0S4M7A3_9BURK|nr:MULTISPECIES: hypothetical protein [Ichthyocystis]CUT18141.1 putative coiled coil protein [Candidatus Ichthyocystis hellenicum]